MGMAKFESSNGGALFEMDFVKNFTEPPVMGVQLVETT